MHAYTHIHTHTHTHTQTHTNQGPDIDSVHLPLMTLTPIVQEVSKQQKSTVRNLRHTLCDICPNAKGQGVCTSLPVSHPHIISLLLSICFSSGDPQPSLKPPVPPPPNNTPSAPCIFWHTSGHTIITGVKGCSMSRKNTHIHPLSVSLQQLAVSATWLSLPCPAMRLFDNESKSHSHAVVP